MTPDALRAGATELRAIAIELDERRERLQAFAQTIKDPARVTDNYVRVMTAAFQTFNAVTSAKELADILQAAAIEAERTPETPEAA